MTSSRSFHLGTILTAATGIYCTPEGMDSVYDLLNFMTGDDLATHQLPRVSRECEAEIYRQHPDLRQIGLSEGSPVPFTGKVEGMAWLAAVTAVYGEHRNLVPLAAGDHTVIDPIAEAKLLNPNIEVVQL